MGVRRAGDKEDAGGDDGNAGGSRGERGRVEVETMSMTRAKVDEETDYQ